MERARASNGQGKFLIDGFPRNPENLHVWNQVRFLCYRGEGYAGLALEIVGTGRSALNGPSGFCSPFPLSVNRQLDLRPITLT